MKDYNKNNQSSYIQYWDVNNLHGWAMLQKLPANIFGLIKDICQFNEDFIKKAIMKKVMKDIFLKLLLSTLTDYMNFLMIYHFYPKQSKLKKWKNL